MGFGLRVGIIFPRFLLPVSQFENYLNFFLDCDDPGLSFERAFYEWALKLKLKKRKNGTFGGKR